MPSLEEAREQAWIKRASDLGSFASISAQLEFSTGWDARGQYDEQRIAALVAAIRGVYQDFQDGFNGAAMEGLRAIAGQPDA